MTLVWLAALLGLCTGVTASSSDVALDKARPVTKVINMMKDMLDQLEVEAKEDEEVFEEMGCWCESNTREKTKAISDAEARISDLKTSIESLTSNSARLNTEIANLDTEVAKNEEAYESATALRRKQLAEFNVEEKDMLSSITSMKGAVSALSKHHEASFLQVSTTDRETSLMAAAVTVQHILRTHAGLLEETVSPHQRQLLTSLLQVKSSAPASSEIFGILTGMKDSFEHNLDQAQKEETENNNAYEDLKAAKTSEIAAGKSLSESKTQELATTDEKNAMSKQDLEDTQNTLDSDMAFLANVKDSCANMDAEHAERTETRQLEIAAVNKALSYLTSDDAHDLFTRTFNMALVQREAVSQRQELVSKVLLEAGRKLNRPRLSMMALRTRGARMKRVSMALEKMVKPLEEEQQAEVEKRDFCIGEINTNEADTAAKGREHADVEAKVEDAKMTIDELTKAIKELKTDLADAKTELKRAGEDRAKANKEFQITVADSRATQKLLRGALRALKTAFSLAQTSATVTARSSLSQPAFKPIKKNKGGILGVVKGVIDDATKLEAEAIRGEEDAQKAYEGFTKDTNDALDVMSKDLANKNEDKAKTVKEKVQKEIELENVKDETAHLEKALIDLHSDCDYLLKNFETRQAARHAEITSLKESISITGGAPMAEFLQHLP